MAKLQLGATLQQRIGNTPLLRLERIASNLDAVQLLAKAEWANPGGSVKDRAASNIVSEALRSGELSPGRVLLDSTSGNTGIAYGMYPGEGSDGAIRRAREMAAAEPERYFYADQYSNEANWRAHYANGTADEIWRQTEGAVTHFVCMLGTSGTFVGTSRRLKELNPRIRCISLQPDSPFHGIEGAKHMATSIIPAIYDPSIADEDRGISTEAAYEMARRLARQEGLLAGVSGAAALMGALEVARSAPRGSVVVTIFPDSGDKYLSEHFWEEDER